MKRLFFFIVFSFLLMSGCTRQEMDSPVQDVHLQGRTMFHASFGDMQTRVHVEGGQALEWTDGDCITVFNLNSGNSMFRLAGITETGRAQFEVISATEGPALGVAILAGVGAGIYNSVEEACDKMIHTDKECAPIADNTEAYNKYHVPAPKNLRYIESVGEILSEDIRKKAMVLFNIPITNFYGSEEFNGIAYETSPHRLEVVYENVYSQPLSMILMHIVFRFCHQLISLSRLI